MDFTFFLGGKMKIKLYETMFGLQDDFNENTIPDWKNKQLDWHRAIWMECGEAVDSTPWKWWKKGTTDMANLEVELVDIWHFIMSYLMESNIDIKNNLENYSYLFEEFQSGGYTITDNLEDMALLALEKNRDFEIDKMLIPIFLVAWGSIGRNTEDLYKSYIIKNCLNKFRQDNGYKEGSYIKMWAKDVGTVEDNVIAWYLANDIEDLDNLFNKLYDSLDLYYKNMKKLS